MILKLDETSDPNIERVLELATCLAKLERSFYINGKEKAEKMIDEELKKVVT